MPILDPDKLPTASSLGERFMQALEQVQRGDLVVQVEVVQRVVE